MILKMNRAASLTHKNNFHLFCSHFAMNASVLFIFLIIIVYLTGCDTSNTNTSKTESNWDQTYDLGLTLIPPTERRTQKLTHIFKIMNPTQTLLELHVFGTSCGCTRPIISEEKIPPGMTGEVKLVVDAAGQSGSFHESATLKTNLIDYPNIRLSLKGSVLPNLDTSEVPALPIPVRQGTTKNVEFQINGRQKLDEPENNITISCPIDEYGDFIAKLGPIDRRVIDNQYRLTTAKVYLQLKYPEVSPSLGERNSLHKIMFSFGNTSIEQFIPVVPSQPIEATPQKVFLKRNVSSSSISTVRIHGKQPFSIVDIDTNNNNITVKAKVGPKLTSHEIKIIAIPSNSIREKVQVNRVEVVVFLEGTDQKTLKIPVLILNPR